MHNAQRFASGGSFSVTHNSDHSVHRFAAGDSFALTHNTQRFAQGAEMGAAILPLLRGPDGALGTLAQASAAGAPPAQVVTINLTQPIHVGDIASKAQVVQIVTNANKQLVSALGRSQRYGARL